MPIIETQSEISAGIQNVETSISASLSPTMALGGHVHPSTSIVATVSGSAFVSTENEVATTIVAFCNGGLAPNPNIFGVSDVETAITATLTPNRRIHATVHVETTIDADLTEQISDAEVFEVLIALDLLTPRPAGGRMYGERLIVDGTELEVREWTAQLKRDGFIDINVELNNVAQRSLINRDSTVSFEIGYANQPFTSFTYKTLIDEGFINESTYQEKGDDFDTFTFTGLSAIHKKLNRTPANGLVVYDPNLVDVDASDFRVIYDDFGRAFTQEILAIPNLTMEKLMTEIYVNRCDFVSVKSTLPVKKWKLSRVDFPAGEPYINAFNQRLGMYYPAYDEVNGTLWIKGTRVPYPSGSPTPEAITASETMDLQLATDQKRVDVIELIYNLFTYEYDYTSTRSENSAYETDNDGEKVITTINRYIQEYYRESQPSLPIHEEPLRTETTDIRGDGWVMESSTEKFYYKGTNRIARRKFMSVPVPSSSPPYTPSVNLALTEAENYYWKVHPFKPSQIYQQRRNLWSYGLIAVDTDNPRADGSPFLEALVDSHRKANFQGGMTITSGPIRSEDEITHVISRDAIETYLTKRDHCAKITEKSYTEQRVGDIGKSALVNDQRSLYVFLEESSNRNLDYKEEMNIGELNPIEGAILARQILNYRKFRPNTIVDEIDGLDAQLIPGATRQIQKADGSSIGIFEIGDVTLRGNESGYYTRFEGIQSA